MREVGVSDLVAAVPPIPYGFRGRDPATGVDCFWCALEVQRRLGWTVPLEADVAPLLVDRGPSGETLEDLQRRLRAFWRAVPRSFPWRLGDVLYTPPRERRAEAAVETVVGLAPLAVLTAVEGVGIVRRGGRMRPGSLRFRFIP